jgi:hypothetical protein
MIHARLRTIVYHLLFWLSLYGAWLLIFRSYSVALTTTMTIEFCYLIFITLDYYIISGLIIPHFLQKKRYVGFVALAILVILVSGGLRTLVAQLMNALFFHPDVPLFFGALFVRSIANISWWVFIILIGKMLIDRANTQKRLEALENERIKQELEFLRSQINPHTLFNSLNTIYGHIDRSNLTARSVLLKYSELLRYQLYECTAEKVSLDKEIAYIRQYVEFQQLRKNDKLTVQLEIEPADASLQVAPLLLIVPIENAFKFVSHSSSMENKIVIRIFTRGPMLHSVVANTKEGVNGMHAMPAGGIGLSNLKRRLALLYERKHHLSTHASENWYEANLTLDLR